MKRFNLMPKTASVVTNSRSKSSGVSATYKKDLNLIILSLPIILAIMIVVFTHILKNTSTDVNNVNNVNNTNVNSTIDTIKKQYKKTIKNIITKTEGTKSKLINEKNRLRNKLDRLRVLENSQSLPLNLLISLGKHVSEKMAIMAITKENDFLTIDGIAQDNESLSEFMDVLIKQGVLSSVSLKISEYSDDYGPYKQKFSLIGVL